MIDDVIKCNIADTLTEGSDIVICRRRDTQPTTLKKCAQREVHWLDDNVANDDCVVELVHTEGKNRISQGFMCVAKNIGKNIYMSIPSTDGGTSIPAPNTVRADIHNLVLVGLDACVLVRIQLWQLEVCVFCDCVAVTVLAPE